MNSKKYVWSDDEKFEISGKDYKILYNSIQNFVNSVALSPASIISIASCYSLLREMLEENITNGKITEYQEPTKESNVIPL